MATMNDIREIIVTGATGFLGAETVKRARAILPGAAVIAVPSPRHGGPDLAATDGASQLSAFHAVARPEQTLLIHTAAIVAWDDPASRSGNAAMGLNVARWAKQAGIGRNVLTSTVSVYPESARCDCATPPAPATLYGQGKLAAEQNWRAELGDKRCAVIRFAGIWGWQPRPTLFWNRVLQAAVSGESVSIRRRRSVRNYISLRDAAELLVRTGMAGTSGTFLAAGVERISLGDFIAQVSALPGTSLKIKDEDDGGSDEQYFEPSPQMLPHIRPFQTNLTDLWAHKPTGTTAR